MVVGSEAKREGGGGVKGKVQGPRPGSRRKRIWSCPALHASLMTATLA